MIKKVVSLLMAGALGASPSFSQTLSVAFQKGAPVQSGQETKLRGGIKLTPSNKFNTQPKDVFKRFNVKPKNAQMVKASGQQMAKIAAAQNVADSVVIYGIYKYTVDSPESDLKQMGMYSFNAAPVFNFKAEAAGQAAPDAVVYVYVKGKYYMFSVGKLAIMDATSGEITQQDTPIQLDGADISPLQAATYDPSTGKIYMVYWKPDFSKGLCTIDPETFEVAHLCDMPGYTLSIAAAPDGKIYFMNYPNSLYSLDKTTGENTLISSKAKPEGGKGYQNSTASQTAAFDWSTGQMYLANLTVDLNTHLTKIDPVTGKAVNVADFPGSERMVGLFIPYAEPATPGFAGKIGYADGKLSFNAPSMAYSSGEAITGTLTAYVSVDGAEPQEHSVQAGELCTIDMPLADGRHIIEISMGNSAGKSPARRLTTFIGKDVPSAVTGLALAIDNGEDAVLSWAAPTTSMHGGEVDDATINYRIVRYPDEVVVAESHKETTFRVYNVSCG